MATQAGARGLRAARLAEILNEIRKGFTDAAFSLERTAARINVSPNYIQKLLRQTGLSFSERVLELRLRKARRCSSAAAPTVSR